MDITLLIQISFFLVKIDIDGVFKYEEKNLISIVCSSVFVLTSLNDNVSILVMNLHYYYKECLTTILTFVWRKWLQTSLLISQ